MAAPRTAPTGSIETPYLKAGQEWDERLGTARVQARNWRLIALGCVGANLLLGMGIIYQSSKSHVVPYVIEVSTAGEVRAVGPAQVLYQPTRAAIQYQIRNFVDIIRGIPTDAVVMRRAWLHAYDMVTPRGNNQLNAYAREREPFSKIGKQSIMIDIQRILPMSDVSFDVRWTETTFDAQGHQSERMAYSGIFAVVFKAPKNEKELTNNPLGIWLDSFSMTGLRGQS